MKTTSYNKLTHNEWVLKRSGKVVLSGQEFLAINFIQRAENLIDLDHLEEYELYKNGDLYGLFELSFKVVAPGE